MKQFIIGVVYLVLVLQDGFCVGIQRLPNSNECFSRDSTLIVSDKKIFRIGTPLVESQQQLFLVCLTPPPKLENYCQSARGQCPDYLPRYQHLHYVMIAM